MTPPSPKTKLHLGCGHIIKDGWLNHDLAPLSGVDVVHDLPDSVSHVLMCGHNPGKPPVYVTIWS